MHFIDKLVQRLFKLSIAAGHQVLDERLQRFTICNHGGWEPSNNFAALMVLECLHAVLLVDILKNLEQFARPLSVLKFQGVDRGQIKRRNVAKRNYLARQVFEDGEQD